MLLLLSNQLRGDASSSMFSLIVWGASGTAVMCTIWNEAQFFMSAVKGFLVFDNEQNVRHFSVNSSHDPENMSRQFNCSWLWKSNLTLNLIQESIQIESPPILNKNWTCMSKQLHRCNIQEEIHAKWFLTCRNSLSIISPTWHFCYIHNRAQVFILTRPPPPKSVLVGYDFSVLNLQDSERFIYTEWLQSVWWGEA